MNRISFQAFLCAILFSWCGTFIKADNTYIIGTYNIRTNSPSDTGDQEWSARKEAVAQTINSYDFDVIGLNELTSAGQKKELQALIPNYSVLFWNVGSSTIAELGKRSLGNGVAYKTEKFELLDWGHYFLSTTPEKSYTSWDSSQKRITVWAKLKNKTTGEIFFYFSTHLDVSGSIAKREGAILNVEMVRKIAGNYPVFLGGDFNSSPSNQAVYYTHCAYLNDSRIITETPFPKQYDGTLNKWDPNNLNVSRLDFIFSRGVRVLTYDHITETFGRDITPSDHLPVIITCTLNTEKLNRAVYVNNKVSSKGDGSKSKPFQTIQEGIDTIEKGDTIYVTEGIYPVQESTNHTGREATLLLNKSVTIIGGYNEDFSEVSGKTTISGDLSGNDKINDALISGNEENAYHVITVESPYALELSHCIVEGGNASDSQNSGAGIYGLGSKIKLQDVIVSKNVCTANGAAIYSNGTIYADSCIFENNVATNGKGGAIYVADTNWWRHTILNCCFKSNSARKGAATYFEGMTSAFVCNSTFIDNNSISNGIFTVNNSDKEEFINFINNIFTRNVIHASDTDTPLSAKGSAICVSFNDASKINLVNNTIIGNRTELTTSQSINGAAVYTGKGHLNLLYNIIAGNRCAEIAADVYSESNDVTSNINIYSCASAVSFTKSDNDTDATDLATACGNLVKLFGGEMTQDGYQAELTESLIPSLKLHSNMYGATPINVLGTSELSESTMQIDIDNNFEMKTSLVTDHQGIVRHTDGTSAIGANEYDTTSSIEYVSVTTSSIKVWNDRKSLTISSDKALGELNVYSITGKMLIRQEAGNSFSCKLDISALPDGIYALKYKTGARKFIKR